MARECFAFQWILLLDWYSAPGSFLSALLFPPLRSLSPPVGTYCRAAASVHQALRRWPHVGPGGSVDRCWVLTVVQWLVVNSRFAVESISQEREQHRGVDYLGPSCSGQDCSSVASVQSYKRCLLVNRNKRQQIWINFVYFMIYFAPPTQIVQYNWTGTGPLPSNTSTLSDTLACVGHGCVVYTLSTHTSVYHDMNLDVSAEWGSADTHFDELNRQGYSKHLESSLINADAVIGCQLFDVLLSDSCQQLSLYLAVVRGLVLVVVQWLFVVCSSMCFARLLTACRC